MVQCLAGLGAFLLTVMTAGCDGSVRVSSSRGLPVVSSIQT